jgi:hypothetical protein
MVGRSAARSWDGIRHIIMKDIIMGFIRFPLRRASGLEYIIYPLFLWIPACAGMTNKSGNDNFFPVLLLS